MTDQCTQASLLVIDDEAITLKNLDHLFTKNGYQVTTCNSGPEGIKALETQCFDVVITDLKMDKVDGVGILNRAIAIDHNLPVILLTGHGSYESVVEAMKIGAYHYLTKPYQLDEIKEIVRNAVELVKLKRENQQLKTFISDTHSDTQFITQNPETLKLLKTMKQVAPSDCHVIISGESGTGKELAARFIHCHSNRKSQPFVAVNCGALQEDLLANELFGHEKGAFTGANSDHKGLIESANGGTLLLDEVSEMSLTMQVKLLRVIQENEVQRIGSTQTNAIDVRFISATNRDLQQEVEQGRFRQDLFYRLNVIHIVLPPLADRKDDISLLAYYFLKKHSLNLGKEIENIDSQVIDILNQYDYPGNVRELENLIERCIVLCTTDKITLAQLPRSLREGSVIVKRNTNNKIATLAEHEIDYIRWVLDQSNGNKTKAAKLLNIDRVSLWRKIKKYNIK